MLDAVKSGAVAIGKKTKEPAVVPKEHRFIVGDLGPQTLAVYSEGSIENEIYLPNLTDDFNKFVSKHSQFCSGCS